jgi:hypothetical protein
MLDVSLVAEMVKHLVEDLVAMLVVLWGKLSVVWMVYVKESLLVEW